MDRRTSERPSRAICHMEGWMARAGMCAVCGVDRQTGEMAGLHVCVCVCVCSG